MNNITKGRNDLIAWENDKPKNFFTSDTNLNYVLRRYMGEDAFELAKANLTQLGKHAATILDESAKIEDRVGNHPRVERWSDLGERIEQIEFHPNHDKTGHLIWQSGIMASQGQT